MLRLSDENIEALRDAVASAKADSGLVGRLQGIYAEIQHQIDLRKPRCDVSGRCCRFDEYGHRLFVTTLEIAAFCVEVPPSGRPAGAGGACPYQIGGLCSVHLARPFGCRVYFCDPTAQDWQQDQYEIFHLRLKELHAQMGVPYFYVDWLAALKALGMQSGDAL